MGVATDATDVKITVKEETLAPEDSTEDSVQEDVLKSFELPKAELIPGCGCPEVLGPKLVEINSCDKSCGFNPLLYLIIFVILGSITMAVSYSEDE